MRAERFEATAPALALIHVEAIEADPGQPRAEFDPGSIRELKESVARVGLVEPLVVEDIGGGRYRLVAGERRLRALRLGLAEDPGNPAFREAPCLVWPKGAVAPDRRPALQLAENLARRDLLPGEIVRGLRAARAELACAEADRALRARGVMPDGYDDGAPREERERALRAAAKAAGLPWPEPPWEEVLARIGVRLSGGAMARVRRILGLTDPVLDLADRLGLTRSAAAEVASIGDPERERRLLEAVAEAGDPGLAAPAAEIAAGDPAMDPAEAVRRVLAARRAAEAARAADGAGADARQLTLDRPPCPPEELERLSRCLRDATAILSTWRFGEYEAGSAALWIERLEDAARAAGARVGEATTITRDAALKGAGGP
ncbi:MAG: ParB N-terminal domain-containing protein [Bacillota bacterium]|nr:ParB N-terminal domain-containing protein [Bacillota bacterium]